MRGKTRKHPDIRLPGKRASFSELADFFDKHDAVELLERGVMALDPDHSDIEKLLQKYWREPKTKQINIRIPATAKAIIEKLAKRKTVEVSTLVRMWVMDSMRREARPR